MGPLYDLTVVFILGGCVGSFANVVIWRLPLLLFARDWRKHTDAASRRELLELIDDDATRAKEKLDTALNRDLNIITTLSHCPHCRRTLTARDLVPLLSWLFLRGKCRTCGGRISARYPLVELLCGLTAAACWLRFAHDPLSFGIFAALGLLLIIVFFIDLDYRLIFDELTYPALALGLLAGAWTHYPWQEVVPHLWGVVRAGTGALAVAGTGWTIYAVGQKLYGAEVFGLGDVKLLAVLGALLGWQHGLLLLFLAFCYGSVFGVGMVVLRVATMKSLVPFGPYLVFAAFTVMLAGPELLAAYHDLMRL